MKTLLKSALLIAVFATGTVTAQTYPNRPIKIIVPYGPGGPTDVVARLIGNGLTKRLGQPVIVDNKPGANTLIGMQALAKAAPDGYTLTITASNFFMLPATMDKMPVQVQDFSHVMKIAEGAQYLIVSTSLPVRTMPELLSYAKANPDKLNFGGSSSAELVRALFNQAAGTRITSVPYKSQNDVTMAFAAGDLHLALDNATAVKQLVASNKARVLATAARSRQRSDPDVPAISEFLPKFSYPWFYYVAGPAGLPEPVISTLHAAISEIVKEPAYTALLQNFSAEAPPSSPAAFSAEIGEEVALWLRTARAAGIDKLKP